jgi:hypothetical protein
MFRSGPRYEVQVVAASAVKADPRLASAITHSLVVALVIKLLAWWHRAVL